MVPIRCTDVDKAKTKGNNVNETEKAYLNERGYFSLYDDWPFL